MSIFKRKPPEWQSYSKEVALRAVEKEKKQTRLAAIALEARNYEVKYAALEKVFDQGMLAKIAKEGSSIGVEGKAQKRLCELSGHHWNGCVCETCGAVWHEWDHCSCKLCGTERTHGLMNRHHSVGGTPHDFRQVPDTCIERCIYCGKETPNNKSYDDPFHQWESVPGQCKERCRVCGMERVRHEWKPAPSKCREKCAICGKVFLNEGLHTFDKSGTCTACGFKASYCYMHGHDYVDVGPAGNGRKMRCSRCGDIMTTAYDPDWYR